jgi:ribosomal protein L7Ae-like RNA K-turn-binding protein
MKVRYEERILSILGIASKTGKIVLGQKALKTYISGFQVKKFLVFASDHGESVNALIQKCKTQGVPFVELKVNKADLGKAIGKSEASAVGIIEETFIEGIKKIIKESSNGGI